MTLVEEFRHRLLMRGGEVGLHTAMLELHEAVEDALAAIGGIDLRSHREDAIHGEGYSDGLREGEELAKCTYLDQVAELKKNLSSWGRPAAVDQ